MKTEEQENKDAAIYFLANYHSLSNAAEFIRSHGEEGFSFKLGYFNKAYLKRNQKLAKRLNLEADQYLKMYRNCGIEINDEMHPDV